MADIKIQRTFVMIKPDAIEKKVAGKIITRLEDANFSIVKIENKIVTADQCRKIYSKTRKNLPKIYAVVEKQMTKEPSWLMEIRGENAVERAFKMRGLTNLILSPEGTIRRDFISDEERELFRRGEVIGNRMHASETEREAELELELFFGAKED